MCRRRLPTPSSPCDGEEVEQPPRPVVRVVGSSAPPPALTEPPRRRTRRDLVAAGTGLAVVVATVVVHARSAPGWTLGTARLRGDDTVAVVLEDRAGPLRVTAVRLTGGALVVTAPGALEDEVRSAQERGVPPVHDGDRRIGRGRHTLLVGVRPSCGPSPDASGSSGSSGSAGSAAVVVEVEQDGRRQRSTRPLPATALRGLPCAPLTVRGGLSPVAQSAGQVQLLLTAHVTSAARPQTLRSLEWPGYQVGGVGAVVPQALARAGIDETVFFDVTVAADCSVPGPGTLSAVFDGGVRLPVPLDEVAAGRAGELRAACG